MLRRDALQHPEALVVLLQAQLAGPIVQADDDDRVGSHAVAKELETGRRSPSRHELFTRSARAAGLVD
jgi:hypothetical protein